MSVRHALLALLTPESKHGLHLKQCFETYTGEIWPLNVGQVYSTLRRLERDGLVVSDAEGSDTRQRLYELTADGRAELDRWFADTPIDVTPPRDELVIKVLVAIAVPGPDPTRVIDQHRAALVARMQGVTKLKLHDDGIATAMVADAELFRLEAAVRWLDAVEARLARGERMEPVPSTTPESEVEREMLER